MSVILFAIPFFLLLIILELVVDVRRKTGYYRANDAMTSLGIGIVSRMMTLAHQLIPFTVYAVVFDAIAVLTLPDTVWVWVMAFIVYDFFYYWKHRMGHEMSILWAAHVVHHSSEDYNLTTALRQTSGALFTWIFFLPMALLGIEPEMLITVAALNLVYQFWVHTQHINRLGWMEYVFVTPSNHRVHHAQNRAYIDKNYGGVFILWDRLFGTFIDEDPDNPPVYGLRGALKSFNPLWANLQVYSQLCRDSYYTRAWHDKFRVWFGRTGWRPADVAARFPVDKPPLSAFKKFNPALAAWLTRYSMMQHGVLLCGTLFLLLSLASLSGVQQAVLVALIILTALQIGLVLQQVKLAIALEAPRLLSMPLVLASAGFSSAVIFTAAVLAAVSLLLLLVAVRQAYPSRPLLAPEHQPDDYVQDAVVPSLARETKVE
ncbi:sterol desaturase family protein [Alteromonas halophila]|uniref:Sterol desaturase n=1 Tax=Alteromonas halophila TaxID=516698 RepID=A0A918JNJ3_9ALTE|nr:sterol desaturase family protein [Alteromonas halophila]GGW91433.1 sterol desaturase [Alteromonas halophila]